MASAITFVRVYLSESDGDMQKIVSHLHDDENVRGVTVFRGICGFGRSGRVHSASLLDLSSGLPVVVEFFDAPEKVSRIVAHLNTMVAPGHIVTWPANLED